MAAGLVDLPTLLQQVAAARRSGVIEVSRGAVRRRIHVLTGEIVACSDDDAQTAAAAATLAVVWAGLLDADAASDVLDRLEPTVSADALRAAFPSIDADGWLDAGDAYFQEILGVVLAWSAPNIAFVESAPSHWEQTQIALGWRSAIGGLLLECLRRQDELGTIAAHLPASDELLVRTEQAMPEDAPPDARELMQADGPWLGSELLEDGWIPPFRCAHAAAWLMRSGMLRVASGAEVLRHADAMLSSGDDERAVRCYRLAVERHVGGARPLLQLAELCENSGSRREAARYYVQAAEHGDLGGQVLALRHALRLGADAEVALTRLIEIYRSQDAHEEAVDSLFELARVHEQKKNYDAAMVCVREAQAHSADAVASAMLLARFAEAAGDMAQARLQLEQAARLAQEAGRRGEALAAWDSLAAIEPGRCDWARAHADLLVICNRHALAVERLESARASPLPGTADDVLASLDERLVAIDPDNHAAHDRLAAFYQRTRDRDGALHQLRLAAGVHERSGDIAAWLQSLERIVVMSGGKADDEAALAVACSRAGLDKKAGSHFVAAVERCMNDGDLPGAKRWALLGLERDPTHIPLRARLALALERDGNRGEAVEHYHRAAQVALGSGDRIAARTVLTEVCRLRPDMLIPRIELAEVFQGLLSEVASDEARRILDRMYQEVIRLCLRRGDQGTALDFARRRVHNAGDDSYDTRLDLVSLLNRLGHTDQELAEGRKLLDALLAIGDIDKVADVAGRLVVSHPDDAEMAGMLAEAHEALGNSAVALRSASHAATLFQVAERVADAHRMLDLALLLGEEPRLIEQARILLRTGQPIDWTRIRADVAKAERQRLAHDIGSGSVNRSGTARPSVRVAPIPAAPAPTTPAPAPAPIKRPPPPRRRTSLTQNADPKKKSDSERNKTQQHERRRR